MPQSEPIVSVIVPCYNSEKTIRLCLTAILNQSSSVDYNVIVVDSSADQTPRIVEEEFPSVQLIKLAHRTFAGAARNAGVKATRATFCVMIDSDCIAAPDLIERMLARHSEEQYAVVGGSVVNGTPRSLSGWIGYLMEFKEMMPAAPLGLVRNVPTGNAAYRREVFERHGYFDEDLWLTEDLLFNWKLYRAGERLLFDPAIKVTHLNRTGWRNVLRYQTHLGKTAVTARERGEGLGFRSDGLLEQHPALISLMPFARLKNAFVWLASHDRKALLLFLLVWPMYLIAAGFWSYGFFQGIREGK